LRWVTPGASTARSCSSSRPAPRQVREEGRAVAEQHRSDGDLQLVDEPGCEALLGDAAAAGERDILSGRGLSSAANG